MKCILLDVDGSIREMDMESFLRLEKRNISYALLPNPDDKNFFIIENNDFLDISGGYIKYDMFLYSYCEEGFFSDDKDEEVIMDPKTCEFQINNAYELYCAVFSIIKLNYAFEILYNLYVTDSEINGLSVDNLKIKVNMNNGELFEYEWKMPTKGSIFSRMSKLCKEISAIFHIPTSDFAYRDTVIRIRNNNWKEIPYSKVKENDLIGFVGNVTGLTQFITASEYNLNCIENQVEVEFHGTEYENLEEEYPNIRKHIQDPSYTTKIDLGLIAEPCFFMSTCLSLKTNQKVEFLSNVRYFCKYIEAYVSLTSIINAKIEDVICLISVTFVYRNTAGRLSIENNENRIESILTKYNPYILQ